MNFFRKREADPYDWDFIRDWCVLKIDTFLESLQQDKGPNSQNIVTQAPDLNWGRLKASELAIKESVLAITDVVNEPVFDQEIEYLQKSKGIFLKQLSPNETLNQIMTLEQ